MATISSEIGQFIKRKQAEEESQYWTRILQSEFEQAATYVRSLLPSSIDKEVHTEQIFVPSTQLGGDIFDYYWLDKDHLIIYLVDVAGHGVRSALLSVSVLNLLRTQSLANTNFYKPVDVLTELNRVFQMDEESGENYFTIWYGVYNPINRELIYSCAGHPPAILLVPSSEKMTVKQLSTDNIAIGLLSDIDFVQDSCTLPQGSKLYVFSDGVYEISQEDDIIWGLDAFIDLLKQEQDNDLSLNNIFEYIQNINSKLTLEDDFSLLKFTVN